jgi:hypothetical protein
MSALYVCSFLVAFDGLVGMSVGLVMSDQKLTFQLQPYSALYPRRSRPQTSHHGWELPSQLCSTHGLRQHLCPADAGFALTWQYVVRVLLYAHLRPAVQHYRETGFHVDRSSYLWSVLY